MTTTTNDTLTAALAYVDRGWKVLPVYSPPGDAKKPRIKHWPNSATSDAETVRKLWAKWPDANVGIATGATSGFFVLDVDPGHGGDESLADLERQHGPLPGTVESLTGGGGRHLLFAMPSGIRVPNRIGGLGCGLDIRGDGGFIVAPPSVHQGGAPYRWELSSDPEMTQIAEAPAWLLERVTERTETTEAISLSSLSAPSSLSALSLSVTQAIEQTLPTSEGQRHRCVFDFARMLKSDPAYADGEPSQMREIVREWHRRALPFMTTKPFDETWCDFREAWNRIKYPMGRGPIDEALRRAKAAPDPDVAGRYDTGEVRLLIKLCRELQRRAENGPFFLDCRTAGKQIGLDHQTAWRRLRMLCADGVLNLTELGTKGRASRYRYQAAA